MRYSSATIVVGVLALLALTAFWPFDPAAQQASVVPLAPAVVQAQAAGASAPVEDPFNPDQSKLTIEQKLDRTIDAEFVHTPISDILDYLADLLEVQIHVNRKSLAEQGVELGDPIDINLKNIKARTVLKLVLENSAVDLDFVERDGFLYVSTVEDLDRLTEVRVYNCRDLLSFTTPLATGGLEAGGFGGGMAPAGAYPGMPAGAPPAGGMPSFAEGGGMGRGGMAGGHAPLTPQERLNELIRTSVESDSWDDADGKGSISEFNGLLVIKQSARVHKKIDELLDMLRKAAELDTPSRQTH